jgi:hypothetical protein
MQLLKVSLSHQKQLLVRVILAFAAEHAENTYPRHSNIKPKKVYIYDTPQNPYEEYEL